MKVDLPQTMYRSPGAGFRVYARPRSPPAAKPYGMADSLQRDALRLTIPAATCRT